MDAERLSDALSAVTNVVIPTERDLAALGEIAESIDDAMMRSASHRVMGPVAVVWDEDPCLCPVTAYAILHEYGCGRGDG